MVRVIHRATETMALLRGHALEVVGLKFLHGQDVIASVANDGNIYVWRLECSGSEIQCAAAPPCPPSSSFHLAHMPPWPLAPP